MKKYNNNYKIYIYIYILKIYIKKINIKIL